MVVGVGHAYFTWHNSEDSMETPSGTIVNTGEIVGVMKEAIAHVLAGRRC